MSDKELISEIRYLHARQDRREGEPPMCLACSPADWPCDAIRAADALEARQPSEEGEYILRLIETIKQTGGSVEVSGVKIMPCDEFGRTAAVPDAATAESEQRAWAIAGHLERDREAVKAERDAALAAIERVRAVLAEERAWREHLIESGDAVPRTVVGIGKVEAALDGAPEPEWEYGLLNPQAPDGGKLQGGAHLISTNREHILAQQRRGHPAILAVRRRKAGSWEPVEGEKP